MNVSIHRPSKRNKKWYIFAFDDTDEFLGYIGWVEPTGIQCIYDMDLTYSRKKARVFCTRKEAEQWIKDYEKEDKPQ